MEYRSPEPADLANVESLNRAFLRWLRARPGDRASEDMRATAVLDRIAGMKDCQIGRLSRAPFLLMSVRHDEERRWRAIFTGLPNDDLLDTAYPASLDENRLVMALLGFLWHIAKRDPHTARLVSGAPLAWCDQLASIPIVSLCEQSRSCLPLEPRLAYDGDFWQKLLGAGTSARKDVRLAARISAMQTVITRGVTSPQRPMAAAACKLPDVSMRAADRRSDGPR